MNIILASYKEKLNEFLKQGTMAFEHGYLPKSGVSMIYDGTILYHGGRKEPVEDISEEKARVIWYDICEYCLYCQTWA